MSPLFDLLSQRCSHFRAFGTTTRSCTEPQTRWGRRVACAPGPAHDARARARSSGSKQVKNGIVSAVRPPYFDDRSGEGVVQGLVQGNQSQDTVAAVTRRTSSFGLLAVGFSCTFQPKAEAVEVSDEEVCAAVRSAFDETAGKSKAPVLLRLVFHDSGTFSLRSGNGGANASVRFELKRLENTGLNRGWKVIEQTMQSLLGTSAEGRVGYADLVALGGAYAVAITGGPDIPIRIGRQDASEVDPEGRLPLETATAAELLQNFADKGFTPSETVVLSGAHTLGNKGFGDPLTFDNQYFKALLQRPWEDKSNSMASMIGLPSDHVLPDAAPCRPAIQRYADSQPAFFEDFAAAFQKLTALGTNLT